MTGGDGGAAAPTRMGPGAEFDLIRALLAGGWAPGGAAPAVLVGPGDDAAVVLPGGVALSLDVVVEGVHFRRSWITPEEIGYRAAAAALSDLAAVAARPIGLLTSLVLPPGDAGEFAVRLASGIREAAFGSGAALLGGDVSATPGPLVVDVAVVGEAGAPATRAGARPGDEVWVTGKLGGAATAVRAWRAGIEPPAGARVAFARPRPRVAEARWLVERGAVRALIDLSDGLAGDAGHLAAAGAVAVVLEAAAVPVHPDLAGEPDAVDVALAGGEDYELCFVAPAGTVQPLETAFRERFAIPLTRVGMVREGEGVYLRGPEGGEQPLKRGGYRHFEGETR